MTVGTKIERLSPAIETKHSRVRRWMVAAAIGIAAAGTGTFFAASGGKGSQTGTPVTAAQVGEWFDPGVEARQDALKRYHLDSAPPVDASFQGALKRYHEDNQR